MKRVEIEVGVAAGLAVALPLHHLLTLPEMCESPKLTPGEAATLMSAFASYLSVPLLFGLLKRPRGARLVWLLTPVVGSMLTAAALSRLLALEDWGPAKFATVWLALCVWTLPFAAVVHYSGTIVRRVRRRRAGPNEGDDTLAAGGPRPR